MHIRPPDPQQEPRWLPPREDWPAQHEVTRVVAEHPRDPNGHCAKCRMAYGLVRYPCKAVRLAVQTFATELGERILEKLR